MNNFCKAIAFIGASTLSCHTYSGVLSACGHPFYPPVSWVENNQLVGLAPAVVKQIFAELGFHVKMKTDYNWKRCLLELKKGNADIAVAAYRISSREGYLEFSSQPVIEDPVSLFVNKESDFEVNHLDDLKNRTVGLLLGDSFGENFDAFLKTYTQIEYVSSNKQNFHKLARKKIDFMPVGKISGQLQSNKLGFSKQIKLLSFQVSTEFYYLALSRKSDLGQYLSKINSRLKEMHEDGTIESLTNYYNLMYLDSSQ